MAIPCCSTRESEMLTEYRSVQIHRPSTVMHWAQSRCRMQEQESTDESRSGPGRVADGNHRHEEIQFIDSSPCRSTRSPPSKFPPGFCHRTFTLRYIHVHRYCRTFSFTLIYRFAVVVVETNHQHNCNRSAITMYEERK